LLLLIVNLDIHVVLRTIVNTKFQKKTIKPATARGHLCKKLKD